MPENVFVVQNPTGKFEADCYDERCGFGLHLIAECDSKQEAERAATKHRKELRRMDEPARFRDREIDQLRAQLAEARAEIVRLRAGEADTPGDPNGWPTPAQWIRRWNDATAAQRLAMAEAHITLERAAWARARAALR